MHNSKKLLRILSDGKIHSGAAIGKKLGITRAAIWKLMESLRELQIPIEAKTNQGYCIPGGLELLDLKKIESALNKSLAIKIFDTLPSTNTFLLERAREAKDDVQVCLAEYQPEGKGRFGRRWVSPFARNIALSLLWRFHCDLNQLAGLSLVMAVAVARALKKLGVKEGLGLKWPNDIFWQGKKLAGILIELHAESHHFCDVVIGVGMNLQLSSEEKKKLARPLVDLKSIAKVEFSRNTLVTLLLNEMTEALEVFEKKGLGAFLKAWESLDIATGKPVELLLGEEKLHGIYQGVDAVRGDLLLLEKGKLQHYSSGEVSLKVGE